MEGIKKLLSAQTAGLPNWAWLLIVGGGIAAAIIVPKVFPNLLGGGTDTGTPSDTGTATPTDLSGYTPAGPSAGLGGGGGTTTDGTATPAQTPATDGTGTNPPTVFPPVQPQPPVPPASTAPKDQCKERKGCIDFHVHKECDHLKGDKKAECISHWTTKCANEHPCGHSLIPSIHTTTDIWPHNRQPRRNTAYMIDNRPVRHEDIEKSPRIRVDLPPIEETTLEKEEEDGNI